MTVYNINLGIGWASSGVEYAQAYRAKVLRDQAIPAKFIFTDFISHDNLIDLTRNIGLRDDEVIWLYSHFTNQDLKPTTFTLTSLKKRFEGELTHEEVSDGMVRFFYEKEDVFLTAYLVKGTKNKVHRVEYVSRGNLIRKDYFTDRRLFTEYYTPRDNRAYLYMRRYFNKNETVAYEEIIDGNDSLFRFSDRIIYSKDQLVAQLIESLSLTSKDMVILDRSTGTGQAVLSHVKPAALGVVVHAEHFSPNAVTDETILWNNYYEYTFSNADKVDFFIVATAKQKDVMNKQFTKFTKHSPKIVVIPVGSIDELSYPTAVRTPYSLVTASRLAGEKHVDWLVKAVIKARQTLPELTFDIYGTGAEEEVIRGIIDENQAQEYIRLCGHKNLTTVYRQYEIYLSASKSEGFGLTLLEAVGSGLPLIGFDVPYGNQTFIKDGKNGYLIPPFESDDEVSIVSALAERIIALYQQGELMKFSDYSYQIAKEYLTARVEENWKELVEDMCS